MRCWKCSVMIGRRAIMDTKQTNKQTQLSWILLVEIWLKNLVRDLHTVRWKHLQFAIARRFYKYRFYWTINLPLKRSYCPVALKAALAARVVTASPRVLAVYLPGGYVAVRYSCSFSRRRARLRRERLQWQADLCNTRPDEVVVKTDDFLLRLLCSTAAKKPGGTSNRDQ